MTEENNSKLYQALVVQYYGLKAKRKAYLEQINALESKLQVLAEQLRDINDILCKHGNYIYEHFEEEQTTSRSEKTERYLIDCEHTKCENCINHNYCEYEQYPPTRK
jgi:hypothetical protein